MNRFMLSRSVIFFGTAFVFWAPGIFIDVVTSNARFGIVILLLVTIVTPVISLFTVAGLLRFYLDVPSPQGTRIALLGIWMMGPVFMVAMSSLSGGGFAAPDFSWLELISTILLFPITTIAFSAHTLLFYALPITTGGLFIFGGTRKGVRTAL